MFLVSCVCIVSVVPLKRAGNLKKKPTPLPKQRTRKKKGKKEEKGENEKNITKLLQYVSPGILCQPITFRKKKETYTIYCMQTTSALLTE